MVTKKLNKWQRLYEWILIAFGVTVVLVTVLIIICFTPGSSADIEVAANEFNPGSEWKLVDETVRRPQVLCIDAVCPSVHRAWTVHRDVSRSEFEHILHRSGWNLSIDGNCVALQNVTGVKGSVCSADGKVRKYDVSVWLAKSISYDGETDIILSIR